MASRMVATVIGGIEDEAVETDAPEDEEENADPLSLDTHLGERPWNSRFTRFSPGLNAGVFGSKVKPGGGNLELAISNWSACAAPGRRAGWGSAANEPPLAREAQ
jgi:hypothetical protein